MSIFARPLAATTRIARSPVGRSAHTLAAEAPVARPSVLRRIRPSPTVVKVAGGVVGALGLGLYIRAAPPSSCWVIIDGAVYDVTNWLAHHPVGAEAILAHAGQDISEAFELIHKPGVRAVVQITRKLKPIGVADPVGQKVAGQ